MKPTQSFSDYLERYVLNLAEAVIDSVEEATQADLVQFIYKIDASSLIRENVSSSVLVTSSSAYTFSAFISDPPADDILPDYLDRQQQELFKQSIVNHRQTRIAFLQKSLVIRRHQIESIQQSISAMEGLIDRASRSTSSSNLLTHYQTIHQRLVSHLPVLQWNYIREVYRVNAILSNKP